MSDTNKYREAFEFAVGGLKVYEEKYPHLKKQIEFQKTVIEALEKQMTKKPKFGEDIRKFDGYTFTNLQCPVCGTDVGEIEDYTKWTIKSSKFCSRCGQAIDWSDEA